MKQYTIFNYEPSLCSAGCGNDNLFTNGEFDLLNVILRNGDVIFDIGANKGYWTNVALSLCIPKEIHCFEPVEETFKSLIEKNHFRKNVKLHFCAIGDHVGEVEFNWYDNNSASAEMSNLFGRPEVERSQNLHCNKLKVQMETVDHICEVCGIDEIDLLKFDVEGAESLVLAGAENVISNDKVKMLFFEYGGCWKDSRTLLKDVFDKLSEKYFFFRIVPNALLFFNRWDDSVENFAHSNVFALRKDCEYRLFYEDEKDENEKA